MPTIDPTTLGGTRARPDAAHLGPRRAQHRSCRQSPRWVHRPSRLAHRGRRYTAHEQSVIDLPPWSLDGLRPPERPRARGTTDVVVGVRLHSRYAAAALHAEVDRVQLAHPGTRNHALNTAAFSLGQLVSNGLLTADDTTALLRTAATNAGLSDPEITRTIRSGLGAGIHH